MQLIELNAETRQKIGGAFAKALRRQGRLPAVVYGNKIKNQLLVVGEKDVDKILRTKLGRNTLISLKIQGGEDQKVLIKDYQGDPLTRKLNHVDFMIVREDQQVAVYIPVRIEGKAAGITNGGILEITSREVELLCQVGRIPEFIVVDVTPLNIGQNLHLADIKLPQGTSAREKYNPTIVLVHAPEKEEAAATPAAAAEGAAAVPATAQKADGAKASEAGKAGEAGKGDAAKAPAKK